MIATASRDGLSRAWSTRWLVVGVWLIHLTLAAAVTFPFWRTLASFLGPLPGGDVLAGGVHLGVLFDLAELRPGLITAVALAGLAVLVLGVLVGAAVTAGVLEVLWSRDQRPLAHRFGRGAGRFFFRFVRLGLATAALFGTLGVLGTMPFVLLTRTHLHEGAGPGWLGPVGLLAAAALVLLVGSLVHDAARIQLVRSDGGAWRALRAGLSLVLSQPLSWGGTWLVNTALLGIALGAFLAVRGAVTPGSGTFLLVTVLAQQAFVLVRTGLRVALLASESVLVERQLPVPATRPAEAPEPQLEPSPSSSAA